MLFITIFYYQSGVLFPLLQKLIRLFLQCPYCSGSFIAASASAATSISTKPKPRLCPLSLSVIIFADFTFPKAANKVLKASSFV
jgi:hypothetical protein